MRYLVFFVLIGYYILIEKKKVGGLKIEKKEEEEILYIYMKLNQIANTIIKEYENNRMNVKPFYL